MGRCLKNVEKPQVLDLHLGVTFMDQVSGLGFGSRFSFGFIFGCWV